MLSSIKVVSSTISCWINCARTFSHTPAFVHARNRLYTLCQGPNLSGRSLRGIPVFSQYIMALSISRLLFAGRPPCGFRSGGSKSLILFHCASLNSCLLIFISLPYWHFAHNFRVLKHALDGSRGMPNFILYIVATPIWVGLYFLHSFCILKIRLFLKETICQVSSAICAAYQDTGKSHSLLPSNALISFPSDIIYHRPDSGRLCQHGTNLCSYGRWSKFTCHCICPKDPSCYLLRLRHFNAHRSLIHCKKL